VPGQRGVARRTAPRRRTMRTRIKSGYAVYVRRFKMLNFLSTDIMPVELEWELWVLDALEQRTYMELQTLGVPQEDWQYYMGFQKRLWEARVKFAQATFQLEKTSLVNEYTLRGWDPNVLSAIQGIAEDLALDKVTGVIRPPAPTPSAFAYFNLIGAVDLREQGGYYNRGSGTGAVYVDEPQGWGGAYFNRQ